MYERTACKMALHDQNNAPLIKFSINRRAFTRTQNGNITTQERRPANAHTQPDNQNHFALCSLNTKLFFFFYTIKQNNKNTLVSHVSFILHLRRD